MLGRLQGNTRAALANLGIDTVYDMLWHLPYRYQDWTDVRTIVETLEGVEQTVVAEITSIALRRLRGGRTATEATVRDATGSLQVWWWAQPYLSKTLRPGMRVGLSGRIEVRGRRAQMTSPEWERLDDPNDDTVHVGRLAPVYHSTKGLPNRTLRRLAHAAVRDYLPLLDETLPQSILEDQGFPSEAEALRTIHFPERLDDVEPAKQRIAFQEMLGVQLAVLARKREARERADAAPIAMPGDFIDNFLAALPFELTAAQQRAPHRDSQRHVQPRAHGPPAGGRRRLGQDRCRRRRHARRRPSQTADRAHGAHRSARRATLRDLQAPIFG